ncbi:MAG: ABC transporter permease [Ruminococcaceae bacterium]|nr:ABC transporter permease [Oscillospiraceae bacterium]
MGKLCRWCYLLNKRLYRKMSFVIMLVLLLAAVCLFAAAAGEDSGFLHVALAQTDPADPLSGEIVRSLMEDDSLILFTRADDPAHAEYLMETGQADSAWIFPAHMQQAVDAFVQTGAPACVRVVEREQNVLLRLSREKLNAALLGHSARAVYLRYARDHLPMLDDLSDEALLRYYEETPVSEELFVFGDPVASSGGQSHYLTAPLRGLLGIITVLGGLAAALYSLQDEQRRTFAWVPQRYRLPVDLAGIGMATLNLSVVSMAALWVAGVYLPSLLECVITLLYALSCACFALLLRHLLHRIALLGSVIPVLTVLMIVVCPVFFDLKQVRLLALLFPPTYYINAVYDTAYLWYMVAFSGICIALSYGIVKWRSPTR